MALTVRPSADTTPGVGCAAPIAETHAEGTRTVVALHGDVDITKRPSLSTVLCRVIASNRGDVIIDLGDATFIDTAIVRTLATAQQLLDRQGRLLTFRSPSRLAARLLQLFGLTDLIESTEAVQP
jgi:anti-anti-sigma factor